jgi:hypothetical protein
MTMMAMAMTQRRGKEPLLTMTRRTEKEKESRRILYINGVELRGFAF